MNTKPKEAPLTQPAKKTSHKLAWLIAILIILAAGLFGWGYFTKNLPLNLGVTKDEEIAKAAINKLQSSISEPNTQSNNLQQTTPPKTLDNSEKLYDSNLAEIASLIRKANLILTTTGDIKTTLDLLLTAKQLASNTKFIELNYAISKDIATLQATSTPDVFTIISKLDILNQQIATLPSIPPQQKPIAEVISAQPKIAAPLWQRFINAVLTNLKEIVIIKRQTIEPLPLPEQINIIRLNIQTKILQAEWAVIHNNNQLYQAALNQVSVWLTQYFSLNTQNTSMLLAVIKDLQKIDLQPEKLSLTNSLQAIEGLAKPAVEKPKTPDIVERAKLL